MANSNNSDSDKTTRASDDLFIAILIIGLLGPLALFLPIPFTGIFWVGIFTTLFIIYLYLAFVYEPITENHYQYIENTISTTTTKKVEFDWSYQSIKGKFNDLYNNIKEFILLIPYLIIAFVQNFSSSDSSSTTTTNP